MELIGKIELLNVNDGDDSRQTSVSIAQDELLLFYRGQNIDNSLFLQDNRNNLAESNAYQLSPSVLMGTFSLNDQVLALTPDNISISYYSVSSEEESSQQINFINFTIPEGAITVNEFNTFSINLVSIFKANNYEDILFVVNTTNDSNTNAIRIFIDNGTVHASKILFINYGTNKDLANFVVSAGAINAAVGNALMSFTSDGLIINNGGFKIRGQIEQNGDLQDLLYYLPPTEDSTGQLYIKGNGQFTGDIYATNGTFNGTINATDGILNNVTIEKDAIIKGILSGATGTFDSFTIGNIEFSRPLTTEELEQGLKPLNDYPGIRHKLYASDSENAFYISDDGDIFAQSITLGNASLVKDYLQFSGDNGTSGFIYNPTVHDNYFIEIKNGDTQTFLLTTKGLLTLGDSSTTNSIKLDGFNSNISGNNWEISPTRAQFNDIIASGKIVSAIFQYNQVQSMGGQFYFQPVTRVIGQSTFTDDNDITYTTIELEDDLSLKDNDIIQINNKYYAIKRFDGAIGIIPLIEYNSQSVVEENLISQTLLFLGQENEDWIIGVNSTNAQYKSLYPQALTFSSFYKETITEEDAVTDGTYCLYDPKIVLGNLNNVKKGETSGYGLYAENVFLHGRLTTFQDDTKTYAGVNTSEDNTAFFSNAVTGAFNPNDVPSENEDEKKTDPIIFWAGASGTSIGHIQASPFQVTAAGYLYAQGGYFTGTLITDATIESAELRTSVITGNGTAPALLITTDLSNNNSSNTAILFGKGKLLPNNPETQQDRRTFEERYFEVTDTALILGKNSKLKFDNNTGYISSSSPNFLYNITEITPTEIITQLYRAEFDQDYTYEIIHNISSSTNEIINGYAAFKYYGGYSGLQLDITNNNLNIVHSLVSDNSAAQNTYLQINSLGISLLSNTKLDNQSSLLLGEKIEYKYNNGYYDIYITE